MPDKPHLQRENSSTGASRTGGSFMLRDEKLVKVESQIRKVTDSPAYCSTRVQSYDILSRIRRLIGRVTRIYNIGEIFFPTAKHYAKCRSIGVV